MFRETRMRVSCFLRRQVKPFVGKANRQAILVTRRDGEAMFDLSSKLWLFVRRSAEDAALLAASEY